MGMFDDIIVPKSYLKGLLEKKYEKYVGRSHSFQTKSFENLMDVYKVHRQCLYFKEYPRAGSIVGDKKQKWKKITKTITVNFYDNIFNKDGDSIWMEFSFSFVNGRLDKKELVKAEIFETKEEKKAIEKMWEIENKIYDEHRAKLKVKFFEWFSRCLRVLQRWVSARIMIPESVRDRAHKASGRKVIV